MSIDRFTTNSDSVTASARAPFAVVPHDTVELPTVPKALYVGGGGTVVLRGIDGSSDAVFRNVANGQVLDVRARYIRATGTTATDIVGLA